MSEEGVLSNTRELIDRVERARIWITIIGLMGIVFSIVFATTTISVAILRPEGLLSILRRIIQVSTWLFGICSVISIIAGIKVLSFIRTWHKSYSNLNTAKEELDKKYFGAIKNP
jgi:choline-glycine betaine transporter